MTYRRMTREDYDAAVTFYRLRPGSITAASEALGVDYRTARKLWRGPQHHYAKWAIPIKDLFEQEKLEERRRAEEREASIRTQLIAEQEKAKALEEEARRIEDGILRIARGDVLGALGGLSRITTGLNKLAERIGSQLEKGTDLQGNPLDIDVPEGFKILRSYAQSVKGLVEASSTLISIERIKRDLPNTIVGINVASVTLEDAMATHELAGEVLERARKLGIINVPGSATPQAPPVLPSGAPKAGRVHPTEH